MIRKVIQKRSEETLRLHLILPFSTLLQMLSQAEWQQKFIYSASQPAKPASMYDHIL